MRRGCVSSCARCAPKTTRSRRSRPECWSIRARAVSGTMSSLRDAADSIDALSLHWYFPGPIGRPRSRDEAELRQIVTASDTARSAARRDHRRRRSHRRVPIRAADRDRRVGLHDRRRGTFRHQSLVLRRAILRRVPQPFIERSDRVAKAYYAQLVNVLGPIQTDGDRQFVTTAFFVLLALPSSVATTGAGHRGARRGRWWWPRCPASSIACSVRAAAEPSPDGRPWSTPATIDDGGVAVALANRRSRSAGSDIGRRPPPKRASGALMAVAAADLFARNSRQRPDAVGVRDSRGQCRSARDDASSTWHRPPLGSRSFA